MNTTSDTSKTVLLPDLALLLVAISHIGRWKMLRELSLGEPREISELANVAGCSYDMARKNLDVLVAAGITVKTRGRCFQLQKQYLPKPGEPVVNFGHCLLRLDAAG